MATKNSIGNISNPIGSTAVTVDPGGSGDSYIQYSINATPEFRIGVDDNDSDKFKISQGSALGTNDTFVMTFAGERTLPLQPAFLAYLGTTDSNVTGNGASYVLGSGNALTEVFDQGGGFVTTGTFTAPVTGRYYLYSTIRFTGVPGGITSSFILMVTSNRTYESSRYSSGALTASNVLTYQISTLVDMDASDTATTSASQFNGGSNGADAAGSANAVCFFGGYLVV